MRPFRFAVQLSGVGDPEEWRSRARQLEDLGYSTLFIPDHFGNQWAPLVALTVAAEATTTLRVGSLVFDNDYRHPVVLAREVATLANMSDERVELGLGAGWLRSDYDQVGIAFDRPGVRIDRLVEGLQIMKDLWSKGVSSRSGRYYSVHGVHGVPMPAGTDHPPIIIGGGGRRILSIAAQEADIIGFSPSLAEGSVGLATAQSATAARFRERVGWVKEAAGARLGELEFQILTFAVQVTEDRERFIEDAAPLFELTPDEVADSPLALVGTVSQICELLEARREEYGFSYWVVHEENIEDFAPVVAAM
ncbi:MAG TPA: TIGR03621 family F420-dependent LLM class oxidoreductase, partial [Acidimicrobiales bacterium]|nr:TIGR03621 family F420-dependent LLM class oxidoreductase [Acidimicrobiales bacterium]